MNFPEVLNKLPLDKMSAPQIGAMKDVFDSAFNFYKIKQEEETKRAEIEKSLLELTVKQALKRNTKLYKVKDKSNEITENLAFFAISVGNISVNDKKIPSVVLDYFILNNKFRNYKCDPDKYTLSIELFREILSIINELSNQIGIRYIILEPLRKEEKLVKFYKEFGFDFIPKNINWMYLDIQQLN